MQLSRRIAVTASFEGCGVNHPLSFWRSIGLFRSASKWGRGLRALTRIAGGHFRTQMCVSAHGGCGELRRIDSAVEPA
jgi:hypothetical protein